MTELKLPDSNEFFNLLENLGNEIAHELRTPLAAIRTGASGIKDYLPVLISAYNESVNSKLIKPTLFQRDLDLLSKALDFIEEAGNRASGYINMLVTNLTFKMNHSNMDKQECPVSQCLREALDCYAYKTIEQKELFSIMLGYEFNCLANSSLLMNVFFNLIKHCIQQFEYYGKGHIIISSGFSNDMNHIYFKGSENGEAAIYFHDIFNKAALSTVDIEHFWISYCKGFLQSIGGNISCRFDEKIKMEIDIEFPPIKKIN